jgi:hypothetical protein
MRRMHILFLTIAAVSSVAVAADTKPAADSVATKLLAEARAARAVWQGFPGFSADVEVNIDGKVHKGRAEVDADGKVTVQLPDEAAAIWARRSLGSIVGHRLPGSPGEETPCVFAAGDNPHHPLGRAVQVVNDEFHSSYQIRDRQIIVVNRAMKDARFTITVLENRANEQGHFLPAHYIVNYWDLKSGQLTRAESHHQTWQRVGRFDMPRGVLVVTGKAGGQEARSLTLTHVRLNEPRP